MNLGKKRKRRRQRWRWRWWISDKLSVPSREKLDLSTPARSLPRSDRNDAEEEEELLEEIQVESNGAKNKLMKIVAMEREDNETTLSATAAAQEPSKKDAPLSLFHRGSDFVRRSFRKVAAMSEKKPLSQLEEFDSPSKTVVVADGSDESQDSGLGEESDCETSLRTPTPKSGIRTSLRKVSTGSTSSTVAKKHVVIQEPSHRMLPSVQRRQFRSEVTRAILLPASSCCRAKTTSGVVFGSVFSQWERLLTDARTDVTRFVPGCDDTTARLVFDPDQRRAERELSEMEDVSLLIHSLYRVLYFDWTKCAGCNNGVIVHCIQRFLVLVVDVADLDMEDRLRFARTFRSLLRSSEITGYKDLLECLERTRRLYIELWCTLLCAPFSGNSLLRT